MSQNSSLLGLQVLSKQKKPYFLITHIFIHHLANISLSQEEGTVPSLPPLPTLPSPQPALPTPDPAIPTPDLSTPLPDLDAISAPSPPLLSVDNTTSHESVVLSLGEGEEVEAGEEYAGLLSYCYILQFLCLCVRGHP